MVVPDDHTGVSQYRLSSRLVQGSLAGAAVVLLILVSLVAFVVSGFFISFYIPDVRIP